MKRLSHRAWRADQHKMAGDLLADMGRDAEYPENSPAYATGVEIRDVIVPQVERVSVLDLGWVVCDDGLFGALNLVEPLI